MSDQTEIEVGGQVAVRTESEVLPELPAVMALPDVGRLMEMAVGGGADGVAALEKLVGLQERIMDRQAENALTEALGAFQAECPQIKQSQTAKIATKSGGSYSFTYADTPEIDRAIKPYLKKHGLSYSFDARIEGNVCTAKCVLRHAMGATVSATFAGTTDSNSGASAIQKQGAALTYAKRQALTMVLGLVTTNADADAMGVMDSTPVTAEQVRELRELVQKKGVNIDKFLAFMGGHASLKALPAATYPAAVNFLESKRDKA